ncbi:flagellar basal body P-ring formation chaperone FlgA [Oharaeibacter diazotrophicus]|uniref:Flagella basal body P-ring formation protein FlgA n=2 Tax=Oharaeibacter diazotrophicus TaxID=1920512 RepID=A0A4R6RNJ3_9HYPH|nr:flagellar basal body P-ring formation chaperone FlgA [Oharaeibacter diazotrophicus]TDP87637.1 flagella basal body P-ring formation protein FlgA [Oharaeibacter diazotrophicus]BBE74780.1 flagellar basal body P-ring biosynthesis protein FlgA [Pleomorphomonas sp. SM30]GLS77162.1 flagellar basal body P-ring biosynthesis protein FlgA [Oharaeibacter diazotrophicus]
MTRAFLLRLVGAALIAALAATLITLRPAAAATLRPHAIVTTDLVTLGDLFDGAGERAATPVFRSPDAGVDGALPAADALAAARAAGLAVDPTAIDVVTVVRAGTEVDEAMLTTLVRDAVAGRLRVAPESLDIDFDALVGPITADAGADRPVTLVALSVQGGSGRFDARLAVDVGAETRTVEVGGRAVEMIDVVVLKRDLERRQVVRADDIAVERVERRRMGRSALAEPDAVVGLAARRALRGGDTLSPVDLEPPRLVLRGEQVTLSYARPGITLSARGRALADGALGETVTVLNEQSRRTVEGIVTANGVVTVARGTQHPAAATAALTQ